VGVTSLTLALLTAACGSGSDSSSSSSQDAATSCSTVPASPRAGMAGIQSKPVTVGGGIVLDPGLAMWKCRPAGETRTGVTKDTVILGVPTPLTGPIAPVGEAPAFKAIIAAVNAAGGVHGRQIVFKFEDNGANPAIAVGAAHKLVEKEQVFAILGSQITPAEQAIANYLVENGIPDLEPNSLAGYVADPTVKTRIAYAPPGELIGALDADYIFKKYPKARVALVYQNDGFGKAPIGAMKHAAEKNGGTIVTDISYNVSSSIDFTSQLRQVVDAKPDVFFVEGFFPQVKPMMHILRATLGSTIPVFFGTGSAQDSLVGDNPDFVNTIGPHWQSSYTESDVPAVAAASSFLTKVGIAPSVSTTHLNELTQLQFFLRALDLAGPDLTRQGIIQAYEYGFNGYRCSLCLGPSYASTTNHWLNSTFQLVKWDNTAQKLIPVTDVVKYEDPNTIINGDLVPLPGEITTVPPQFGYK
jgi:ABC-type branched-subunit amino acid transport system substrate-binding protein